MLKVKAVTPFNGSTATPNALLIVGGNATMVAALAVLPSPPSNVLILEVRLFFTPAEVPVIDMVIEQVELAGMIPPAKLMELDKPTAVTVPPQVLENMTGLATTNPAGSASVKDALVRGIVLGLASVKVRLVFELIGNAGDPKTLLMEGGSATAKVALAGLPVNCSPVSVEKAVTFEVTLFLIPLVTP